jgi:hypothetical protein
MNITELQNLNRDYEFLMDFIGLAQVHNEQGLTEYTTDKLEALECILYDDLDIEEKEQLEKHLEGLKELIETVINRMQRRVKMHLIEINK